MNVLVCASTALDGRFDADCSYAVIIPSPDLAQRILRRHKTFLLLQDEDRDLDAPAFFDDSAYWLSLTSLKSLLTEEAAEELAADRGGGWEYVDLDRYWLAALAERTEAARMKLWTDGVYWSATNKHTDVRVESSVLPYEHCGLWLTLTETDHG